MTRQRRSAVYVVLHETVGHDLVFKHYTKKVVVGNYTEPKMQRTPEQLKSKRGKPGANH